jgi:hypothetical protein
MQLQILQEKFNKLGQQVIRAVWLERLLDLLPKHLQECYGMRPTPKLLHKKQPKRIQTAAMSTIITKFCSYKDGMMST